jgi:outer membrane protein OmpA-like peptidoglycan-associated protein
MSMKVPCLTGLFAVLGMQFGSAQDTIRFSNPSFEGPPRHSQQPLAWYDCGFPGQSPPDTHPAGAWGVSKKAFDGQTYLGMVTRADGTWEAVGQPLAVPLVPGQCYELSAIMCMSEEYLSPTRQDQTNFYSFTTPIVLRVWGGNGLCAREELLGESAQVDNTEWLQYNFRLKASKEYRFVLLEAFYKTPTLLEYNGNILVDNLSDLIPVDCAQPLVMKRVPEPKAVPMVRTALSTPPKESVSESRPNAAPAPSSSPEVVNDVKALQGKKIEQGQIIRMDNLYFMADSVNLDPINHAAVNKIYQFLLENPTVKVEIGGHTNGLPKQEYCLLISEKRAKSVADYLVSKGIEQHRVTHKGYGKLQPIADNATSAGRRKNQRVEVKILSN